MSRGHTVAIFETPLGLVRLSKARGLVVSATHGFEWLTTLIFPGPQLRNERSTLAQRKLRRSVHGMTSGIAPPATLSMVLEC